MLISLQLFMAALTCVLCFSQLTKACDRNLIENKEEFSVKKELEDLHFVVHTTSQHICRMCLRSLQQRRNHKKKLVEDLDNNLLRQYREKAGQVGLAIKTKATAKRSLSFNKSDDPSSFVSEHGEYENTIESWCATSEQSRPTSTSTPCSTKQLRHEVESPHSRHIPSSAQAIPQPAKAIPPSARAIPPSAQDIPTASPAVPMAAQGIPPSARAIPPSAQAIPPSAQAIPPSAQAIPPSAQAIPPSAQAIPPSAQAIPPSAQAIPPSAQAIPPSAQAIPPSAQDIPTASQAVPMAAQEIPPAVQPDTQPTIVSVTVQWRSRTSSRILPHDLQSLGKMLCRGTYLQVARAAWRCAKVREHIILLFLKEIYRECAAMCSRKSPSILRKTSKEDIVNFSLTKLDNELRERTHLLRSVLMAASIRKSSLERSNLYWMPAVCMASSICLKNRSPHMTVVQLLNTIFIQHSGLMVCCILNESFLAIE